MSIPLCIILVVNKEIILSVSFVVLFFESMTFYGVEVNYRYMVQDLGFRDPNLSVIHFGVAEFHILDF